MKSAGTWREKASGARIFLCDNADTAVIHGCDHAATALILNLQVARAILKVQEGKEDGKIFIGDYINKSPKERVYQLLDCYKDFWKYRENYKNTVVDLMMAMREYSNRPGDDDLGIRVQTMGGTSNITASRAIERIELERCFLRKKVDKAMFPDPYERELISTAVCEWDVMTKEFNILNGFMDLMKASDRSIFIPYINREKRVADIADELCLQWESANKKVYRIRKALLKEVLPCFKEYKIAGA